MNGKVPKYVSSVLQDAKMRHAGELACLDVLYHWQDLLATGNPNDRKALDSHLSKCPSCAKQLEGKF